MTKDDIYKIIEFNGVYDDRVKRNLRKLIKKYHPDKNKNDLKTIEIIYEVKRELENNKIQFKVKEKEEKLRNSFIDKEECLKNISRLEKIEYLNQDKINKLYNELSKVFREYASIYEKFCNIQNIFCETQDRIKKMSKVKYISRILCFIIIGLFIYSIIFYNITFILILTIVLIIFIIYFILYYKKNKVIEYEIKKNLTEINKYSKKISRIQEKIKVISGEIHTLERNNNNVKNDIRFYNNMKIK